MVDAGRRRFLKYVAGAAGVAVVGALGYEGFRFLQESHPGQTNSTSASTYQPPSNATPNYSEFLKWLASASKPYAGQSINLALEYEFTPLALQSLDLDFFNASRINDSSELKPYFAHFTDISLMVRTQSPTYDVFSVDYQDVAFFKDHILSPTELSSKYPDLTFEGFKGTDFRTIPWSFLSTYPPAPYATNGSNQNILFIPLGMSTMVQYYREDVYGTAGLSPSATWSQYTQNAKTLLGSKAVFGTVDEAAPDISVVNEFLNFLAGYEGNLWRFDGQGLVTTLDTDAALNALETWIGLKPFADSASSTFSWPDMATELLRGVGAGAILFDDYAPWMDDGFRSHVVDKMGYAPNPAGPKGGFSAFGGSGVGVSKYSKHPEAAWLWLQWATALGTQEMALLTKFHSFPSRNAVFDEPDVRAQLDSRPFRATKAVKQVWDANQIATLVPFPKWFNVLDPISYNLNQAWNGNLTPSTALSTAVQKIQSWGTLAF